MFYFFSVVVNWQYIVISVYCSLLCISFDHFAIIQHSGFFFTPCSLSLIDSHNIILYNTHCFNHKPPLPMHVLKCFLTFSLLFFLARVHKHKYTYTQTSRENFKRCFDQKSGTQLSLILFSEVCYGFYGSLIYGFVSISYTKLFRPYVCIVVF